MKIEIRPAQITEILEVIDSEYQSDMGISLKAYIADLEARQPERPVQIVTILETINSDHPDGMGSVLEEYVSDLESRQQKLTQVNDKVSSYDPENPPVWSHHRLVEREQKRRKRAVRRRNNYQ